MTVTYSVCVSGARIDYSRVTSVSYTYSVFYIKPAVFGAGLRLRWPSCWAMLAQLYGYASAIAVTVSVRFCGGRFDSFLGFEYVVLITLASRVFEYFLRFLLQGSLRYLRILASLGVTWCDPPTFLPTLTFSSHAVPLLGF